MNSDFTVINAGALIRGISGFEAQFAYKTMIEYQFFGSRSSYQMIAECLLRSGKIPKRLLLVDNTGNIASLALVSHKFLNKRKNIALFERPVLLMDTKSMELIIVADSIGFKSIANSFLNMGGEFDGGNSHLHVDEFSDGRVYPTGVNLRVFSVGDEQVIAEKVSICRTQFDKFTFPESIDYLKLEDETNEEFQNSMRDLCNTFQM
jgi:hypothetical protein